MKGLAAFLVVVYLIASMGALVYGNRLRDTLLDKCFQQQYQLEVLVCRFNDKQPGEWAEFLSDGTVSYWKNSGTDTARYIMNIREDVLNNKLPAIPTDTLLAEGITPHQKWEMEVSSRLAMIEKKVAALEKEKKE